MPSKEQRVIEIINKKGIKLLMPESDYSCEHITIEIYTKTLSKSELELVKEVLDL